MRNVEVMVRKRRGLTICFSFSICSVVLKLHQFKVAPSPNCGAKLANFRPSKRRGRKFANFATQFGDGETLYCILRAGVQPTLDPYAEAFL